MYWPSLVKFGLGDCQIIPLSSLIVSFMKTGTQKAEVHAWVYLKSCHNFYIFVTIRITFSYGRCSQNLLVFNEFYANMRGENYPLVRGVSKFPHASSDFGKIRRYKSLPNAVVCLRVHSNSAQRGS